MKCLREIEDAAARDGVDHFKTAMEIFILGLLNEDRNKALAQLDAARDGALYHIKNFGCEFFPIEHEVKAARIAIAMIEHSFNLMRRAVEDND